MSKCKIYDRLIELLNKHLSGEKKLTDKELECIGMDLEEDIPWADSWVMHGYKSYDEWHDQNRDYLDQLNEVLDLYRSIPEVKALVERKATEHKKSYVECTETSTDFLKWLDEAVTNTHADKENKIYEKDV